MTRIINPAVYEAGTPQHFRSLDRLIPHAKARARQCLYDGVVDEYGCAVVSACASFLDEVPDRTVLILFTRDVGHHAGGWWKNPDYERCWHLSLSHRSLPDDKPIWADKRKNEEIARAFFGDDTRYVWVEGAFTPEGRVRAVSHYRLFADESWDAIKPRGEVYDRRNTPPDWKSFSEIHGYKPAPEDAPFLSKASGSGDE